MKISKLFHWLYACLMLMPIFAIGVKCGYIMFNKNAKDSWSGGEVITYYEYQSNDVNNINDLKQGNIYHFEVTNYTYDNNDLILRCSNVYNSNYVGLSTGTYSSYCGLLINSSYFAFYYDYSSTNNIWNGRRSNTNYSVDFSFDFVYLSSSGVDNYISYISRSSYLGDEITTITNTLDNAFYYAVDDINNQPIFAWANDSFLSVPITYIGSLFGVQSGSAIYTMLSYWLSISIIWLTFDLLMYIPLLAHRWIDKGILE